MCTAVTFQPNDLYFGRTLDYEISYMEQVTITPRNYPFHFRRMPAIKHHYAMIGMASMQDGYPLYFDAVNEKGLGMAGLAFVHSAKYLAEAPDADNLASFELIPWILCQCASVQDARQLLKRMRITDDAFREDLPPSPLHWIIADKREAITVEAVADGVKVYDNPIGVLTNEPPFPKQLQAWELYGHLSARTPENIRNPYSRGMGTLGLPGDLTSTSRFVRAAFVKKHSLCDDAELSAVNQFFHILGSVAQPRGCCETDQGKFEKTIYTGCCNATKGIYYYTTYENSRITAVNMFKENLDGEAPVYYCLTSADQILRQN